MSRQLHLDSPRYPQPCGDRECRRCYPPTPAEARAAYVAAWDELQRSDLDRLRDALDSLAAALVELLQPTFEAFADLVERLAWLIEDSRPVRWLNRRARRAAMRRHPAGSQLGVVTVDVSLDMSKFVAALDAMPSAEDLARRAGIRLPELPPARIYTPPAALSWVDVDRLAERAGQDLGTFDAILAAPTPAEIPPAPLCQPVNAGQHVGRMRRHTWRELLQLPGRDMA
ncbi:hypothetical protein SEA_TIMOTEA_2 [Microbacterium phage TimoTea]|nr:hypothetical protein SEA_TIMOTEA_2 [Microbacterium phage TimoTea]